MKKDKKLIIFTALMWISVVAFVIAVWGTSKPKFSKICWIVAIISGTLCVVFSILVQNMRRKSSAGSTLEAQKQYLVNYAFDHLLKEGEDYTVAARVEGAILVKKIPTWYYFHIDPKGTLHALFLITTDKGDFAFQAEGNQLMRIDAEMVKSMYDDNYVSKPKASPTPAESVESASEDKVVETTAESEKQEVKPNKTTSTKKAAAEKTDAKKTTTKQTTKKDVKK